MQRCAQCGAEYEEAAAEGCPQCAAAHSARAYRGFYSPRIHVSNAIIFANVLIFLAMLLQGAMYTRSLLPIALPQFWPAQLAAWGANWGPLTLTHEPWRLLSSNYLHGGLFHLLTNMLCVWGLGRVAEHFYSKADFFLAYTFTGVMGSLFSVFVRPFGSPAVGASGAVFGVAGMLLTTLRRGRVPLPDDARKDMYRQVLQFAGLNLVIGLLLPHVDNMGHAGGLIGGAIVGAVMGKHLDQSHESKRYRSIAWGVMVLVLCLAILGAMRFHQKLIFGIL